MASCARWMTFFIMFLEVGVALAIVIITAVQLTDATWTDWSGLWETASCSLGTADGESLCNLAYILGGITLGVVLVLGVLKCLTCGCCGSDNLALIFDALIHACMTALYVAAGIVFAKYVVDANDEGWPSVSWRNSIVVLTWVGAMLWCITFIISVVGIDCMKCCHGGGRKKEAKKTEKVSETSDAYSSVAAKYRKKADVEAPGQQQFISK